MMWDRDVDRDVQTFISLVMPVLRTRVCGAQNYSTHATSVGY